MTGQRSGDRNVVGGDRAVLDRGLGFKRRGDRWLPDRWLIAVGGGSGGFDPTTIAGLKLWLKANALSLNNNDPVTTWTDSSGTNNHGTQSTAANKPLFKTNIINGLPAVLFDGSDDFMNYTNVPTPGTLSLFVVTQPTLNSASQKAFACMGNGGNGSTGHYLFARLGDNAWGTFCNTAVSSGNSLVAGTNYLLEDTAQPSPGAQTFLYQKGVQVASRAAEQQAGGASNPGGCGKDFVNANREYAGYLAEILLYDSVISTADRQAVENYLISKYAL